MKYCAQDLTWHILVQKDQTVFFFPLCSIVLLCSFSVGWSTWGVRTVRQCVPQHTLGYYCYLVENAHVTTATADPIISAPF